MIWTGKLAAVIPPVRERGEVVVSYAKTDGIPQEGIRRGLDVKFYIWGGEMEAWHAN